MPVEFAISLTVEGQLKPCVQSRWYVVPQFLCFLNICIFKYIFHAGTQPHFNSLFLISFWAVNNNVATPFMSEFYQR